MQIVNLLLIYYAHSAPQFFHQQNPIYPNYFYQQVPFIYNPYPNPFYHYNYANSFYSKNIKPESDKKSFSDSTTKIDEKSVKPVSHHQWLNGQIPFNPFVQYVPAYGRNVDSWTATEIPVTVVVDEAFHKSYNTYQNPHVRNYVEQSKQNPPLQHGSSSAESVSQKTSEQVSQNVNVQSSPIDKQQFVQGAPLIPNVAGINTPQASISFFPHFQGLTFGRDLSNWNINEIPISAVVVDEGVDKNSEK